MKKQATLARGRADGERERRGRPVDHTACHELQDDVAVVIDVALLDVVEETELLNNLLSFGNVQTSLTLHSLNRRFLGLDAECGDQRGQLLDVNHNQNSFAIILRKATLIGRCGKRQGF